MTTAPQPRPIAVVDIDGVVADVRHRLHFLDYRPKNWLGFFAAAPDDPPIPEGVARVQELAGNHDVVFLTGRPERCRRDTERWLERHGIGGHPILMRRNTDRRPARQTKHDELRRIARDGTVAVMIDDDPEVVEELTRHGWPVELAQWVPHPRLLQIAQERDGRT